MTQEKEALKLALEAFRKARRKVLTTEECHSVIMSIKETLAQPQRTWVGLTDEEKLHIEIMGGKADVMLAEMVEAKLKDKNT